jgi:hypothetical protein
MTATELSKPEDRVVLALAYARKAKHHPDCRCRTYDGYCTPNHKLWSTAVDRELLAIKRETP